MQFCAKRRGRVAERALTNLDLEMTQAQAGILVFLSRGAVVHVKRISLSKTATVAKLVGHATT